jgi:hypothetical protein
MDSLAWQTIIEEGREQCTPRDHQPSGTGNAAGVLRTLAYDNASRIVGMSHTSAATTPPTAQGALDQAFGYDGLDRLNEAQLGGPGSPTGNNPYWAYGYDLSGNRNEATVGTASFLNTVSPSSNQLTSVQQPSAAAPGFVLRQYSYDAAGHLVSDGVNAYAYSERGRLRSATIPSGSAKSCD